MSRDFTPEEMYLVEQNNIQKGLGSLCDFMANTTVAINGVTTPMCPPEAIFRRQQYPLLGRLYNRYDQLYAFLSQIKDGMNILDRHEKELDAYIKTGKGNTKSPVIAWFKGELDPVFHYSTRNDMAFYAIVQDEVGKLLRFDPSQETCFWFALSDDKCISVWLYPDDREGDQLLMKLEQRAEDGSMGPHCEVLIDESYGTGDLSRAGICECLQDIHWDAGLGEMPEEKVNVLSEQVMAVFGLCKRSLDSQIESAGVQSLDHGQRHSTGRANTPESKDR